MTKQINPLVYGLLGLPLAFAALPVYVHVPRLYAEVAGLSLTTLGLLLFAVRALDVVADPWFGALADRVPARRMVGLALIPLTLGYLALFHPPAEGALLWLGAALVLTYAGLSAATIAHQSLASVLGAGSTERASLSGAREGLGLAGVLLAAVLPTVLGPDLNQNLTRMAWLLPLLLLATAPFSLRRAAPPQPAAPALPWRLLLANRALRRLLLVGLANGIAGAIPATLFLFFVADVLRAEAQAGPLLLLYFVSGALSLPLWLRLTRRYGRVRAWRLAMGLAILAFAATPWLQAGQVLPFALVCLASGLALGADLAVPAAVLADIGARLGQGGACAGVWQCLVKFNLAAAAGLALPLLALAGYVPGQGSGLSALALAYGGLPLILKALAMLLLTRWHSTLEEAR